MYLSDLNPYDQQAPHLQPLTIGIGDQLIMISNPLAWCTAVRPLIGCHCGTAVSIPRTFEITLQSTDYLIVLSGI